MKLCFEQVKPIWVTNFMKLFLNIVICCAILYKGIKYRYYATQRTIPKYSIME